MQHIAATLGPMALRPRISAGLPFTSSLIGCSAARSRIFRGQARNFHFFSVRAEIVRIGGMIRLPQHNHRQRKNCTGYCKKDQAMVDSAFDRRIYYAGCVGRAVPVSRTVHTRRRGRKTDSIVATKTATLPHGVRQCGPIPSANEGFYFAGAAPRLERQKACRRSTNWFVRAASGW
jgi:hypothetical protein